MSTSSVTVDSLRGSMFTLAGNYLLYGLYIPLFSSTVILIYRHEKAGYRLHSAATISLFLLATIDVAVDSYGKVVNISWILSGDAELARIRGFVRDVLLGIFLIADIIADIVLIFRCYVIWGSKKRVIAFPVCLLIVNLVYAISSIAIETSRIPSDPNAPVPKAISTSQAIALGLIALENMLLTVLISGRIWWFARNARVFIGSDVRRVYYTILAVLLESGMIYTSALIASLIFSVVVRDANTIDLTGMLIQTVGIAPTLIIFRSTLGINVDRRHQGPIPSSGLSLSFATRVQVGDSSGSTQSFALTRLS